MLHEGSLTALWLLLDEDARNKSYNQVDPDDSLLFHPS